MSFGQRLKERREALQLKQSDLAEILNVTGAAVSNYEKSISFPKADVLYKVFDALGCDANYLFQDEMASARRSEQNKLINLYMQLNDEGQEKLIDYADDLVSSGKYIKNDQDDLAKGS